MKRSKRAIARIGRPSRIKGLALPAAVGFLLISFPIRRFPMIITIEEMIGSKVSKSKAELFKPKTLS